MLMPIPFHVWRDTCEWFESYLNPDSDFRALLRDGATDSETWEMWEDIKVRIRSVLDPYALYCNFTNTPRFPTADSICYVSSQDLTEWVNLRKELDAFTKYLEKNQ